MDPGTLSSVQIAVIGILYGGLLAVGIAVDFWFWRAIRQNPVRWPPRMNRLIRRAWEDLDVLTLALPLAALFFSVVLISGWILQRRGPEALDQLGSEMMIVQSVSFHWAILGLVALIAFLRHRSLRSWFGLDVGKASRWLKEGVLGYIAMVPLFVGFAALYHAALRGVGYDPPAQEVIHMIAGETQLGFQVYLFFVAIVVAPIAEELLFRGIAFPWMTKRIGVGPAMFLVSLLFAAIHMHVGSLVPLFVISIVFCVAYAYSGSLFVPIIMHGLFNGVNLSMVHLIQ